MPNIDNTNYNLGEPPSVFLRTKRKMGRRTKRMLCRDTNRIIGSSGQSLSLGMKSKQITKRGQRRYTKVSIKLIIHSVFLPILPQVLDKEPFELGTWTGHPVISFSHDDSHCIFKRPVNLVISFRFDDFHCILKGNCSFHMSSLIKSHNCYNLLPL